jgi:hypothetical protein
LAEEAPEQLHLDHSLLRCLEGQLSAPSGEIFDAAQGAAFALLVSDSYPKYAQSIAKASQEGKPPRQSSKKKNERYIFFL